MRALVCVKAATALWFLTVCSDKSVSDIRSFSHYAASVPFPVFKA
jgi:hypothetical protein